jgi:hypothetical protein
MRKVGAILFGLALAALLPRGVDALTLSPPFVDYSLNPGDTVVDTMKLYNESQSDVTLYPYAANFEAGEGETGVPQFYPADEDRGGIGLAEWIEFSSDPIVVKSGERANLVFTVNVPNDAQPGGHYGTIIVSTQAPEDLAGKIGLHPEMGELVLIRVSGEVKEAGGIAEYGLENPKPWYNHLPVDFYLRFENIGNTHLRPVGNILIKDWLGRQAAAITVNDGMKSVLPRSVRRFEAGWKNLDLNEEMGGWEREWRNFALGRYTARVVLNYGQATNQVVTQEVTFYVWPWRLMLAFGGAIVLTVALIWLGLRAHNRRLINKYRKMGEGKVTE